MRKLSNFVLSVILVLISGTTIASGATVLNLNDPAIASQATQVWGAEKGNWLGDSIHLAELDNDPSGQLDIVLGSYKYSRSDADECGRIYILFGPVPDVTTTIDMKNPSGDYLIIEGDEAKDLFGYSITTGDINHDTNLDLIVSAPLASTDEFGRCGKTYVFFGKPGARIVADGTGPYLASDAADYVLTGAGEDDNAGIELLVADFTLDGTDDLVVAAPFGDFSREFENRAYVFSGSETPYAETTIDLGKKHEFLILNIPYDNSTNLNNTGLTFGNIVGDKVPDATPYLIFGTKGAKLDGDYLTGRVTGLMARAPWADMLPQDRWIDLEQDDSIFTIDGPFSGAKTGEVVKIARVDNDNYDDLIIASSGIDPRRLDSARGTSASKERLYGAVHVIYGPIPAGAAFDLEDLGKAGPMPDLQYTELLGVGGFDVGIETIQTGPTTQERILAISDSIVNATPDIKIEYAGRVNVLYMSSLKANTTWDLNQKPADVVISGATKEDELGRTIAFAYVYKNGVPAVVAGSAFADPQASDESDPRKAAGIVYILPTTILSPVAGDMTSDKRVDYKDVFRQSTFWYGDANWHTLKNWHTEEK